MNKCQWLNNLTPFQVVSCETEKSGHVKQSAKNTKRFPLERGNKETNRIHKKQSKKKSQVKKSIRGDQNTVKTHGKGDRKRRG